MLAIKNVLLGIAIITISFASQKDIFGINESILIFIGIVCICIYNSIGGKQ